MRWRVSSLHFRSKQTIRIHIRLNSLPQIFIQTSSFDIFISKMNAGEQARADGAHGVSTINVDVMLRSPDSDIDEPTEQHHP
jgi:hypothetical protein